MFISIIIIVIISSRSSSRSSIAGLAAVGRPADASRCLAEGKLHTEAGLVSGIAYFGSSRMWCLKIINSCVIIYCSKMCYVLCLVKSIARHHILKHHTPAIRITVMNRAPTAAASETDILNTKIPGLDLLGRLGGGQSVNMKDPSTNNG